VRNNREDTAREPPSPFPITVAEHLSVVPVLARATSTGRKWLRRTEPVESCNEKEPLLGGSFAVYPHSMPLDILQIVPEPIARKYNIVSFEKQGQDLKVAMLNPEDLQTVDFIKKKSGLRIVPLSFASLRFVTAVWQSAFVCFLLVSKLIAHFPVMR